MWSTMLLRRTPLALRATLLRAPYHRAMHARRPPQQMPPIKTQIRTLSHPSTIPPATVAQTASTAPKESVPVEKQTSLEKQTPLEILLSPPALVITRDYEWANILIGFEQANKYTIRSAPTGEVVGYLAEESTFGSMLTRNLLRTRRPFKATVFDKAGDILFTMSRPLYLISTSIQVQTADAEHLGEVHMHWHAWRRRYRLYTDRTQFANIDQGFLAVDFDMRDENGRKLASVNKDFTGLARELFTDARQYVLRMDPSVSLSADGELISDASTLSSPDEMLSKDGLGHRERAVIIATAICIDFDYFSLHSRGHMHPGMMMMPGGGAAPMPGAGAGAGAGAAVGADVLSDMGEAGGEAGGEADGEGALPSEGGYTDDGQTDEGGMAGGDGETEWATFEEPDHGFQESEDGWEGSGDADASEEGGSSVIGMLSDFFSDD